MGVAYRTCTDEFRAIQRAASNQWPERHWMSAMGPKAPSSTKKTPITIVLVPYPNLPEGMPSGGDLSNRRGRRGTFGLLGVARPGASKDRHYTRPS